MNEVVAGTELNHFTCRICGNSAGLIEHCAREMFFGKRQTFSYIECVRCGTIQIKSVPELSPHYPAGYYSFNPSETVYNNRRGLKKKVCYQVGQLARRNAARSYLYNKSRFGIHGLFKGKLLKKHWERVVAGFPSYLKDFGANLNINTESAILDFGSGAGQTLIILRHFGFTHLIGIDPFIEEPVDLGSNVKVLKASLNEISNVSFDLILANHSLEHVTDPVATIRQMYSVLRSKRYAIIRMPVVSHTWRIYGTNWVQLDPPRHLFLFTTKTFSKLAVESGFSVHEIKYDSTAFQFWGSEQYAKNIPLLDERSYFVNPEKSIFSMEEIERFESKAATLNQRGEGDQAIFYLYKS